MPVGLATVGLWDQRIQRASHLAKSYDFAAEILDFYGKIASCQRSVFNFLESSEYASAEDPDRLPESWDSFVLLPQFQPLLQIAENRGPGPLAQQARELSEAGPDRWEEVITGFWTGPHLEDGGVSHAHDFFALALLQPYAEYLSRRARSWANYTLAICPFCSRSRRRGYFVPREMERNDLCSARCVSPNGNTGGSFVRLAKSRAWSSCRSIPLATSNTYAWKPAIPARPTSRPSTLRRMDALCPSWMSLRPFR